VRFGISTHLYHEQRLSKEHLLELAEFGFRDIELFATVGHFDYHDGAAIDRLGAWMVQAGLTLHSVHAPIVEHLRNGRWGPALSTAAAGEEHRRRAVAEAVAALGIARRVPYRFLVVHLGVPDAVAEPGAPNSRQASQRSLEELGAAASEVGVRLAVEVIPNKLSDAEALVTLIEDELDLPRPGPGICLDVGHAFLMGDLADAIEVVSGELITTHVHDNRGTEDDHLVPFDGRIDWPTALMSMQKVGYEGLYLFEVANTGSTREVLAKTVEARRRFEEIVRN
jgi:sugar phosphate isomerase/epimerase